MAGFGETVTFAGVADEVGDASDVDSGLELIGLCDKPIRKLAAVAHALDTHPLAVNPQIAAHRRAHAVQDILAFVSVLIAKDGVGEFLSISARTAIVDVQRGPATRRVDLILEIE